MEGGLWAICVHPPPQPLKESYSYFTTGGLPPISSSWHQAPWHPRPVFFFSTERLGYSPYVLSFTVAAGPRRGTHDHILLSQTRNSPNLEGHVPVFISSRSRVAQLYPQAQGSLFVASYDSQGYGGDIRTRLHTGTPESRKVSSVYTRNFGSERRENTTSNSSCVLSQLSLCVCVPIPLIVAKQRHGQRVPTATNPHAAVEEWLDSAFSVRSLSHQILNM
jgi:hypothetical protein